MKVPVEEIEKAYEGKTPPEAPSSNVIWRRPGAVRKWERAKAGLARRRLATTTPGWPNDTASSRPKASMRINSRARPNRFARLDRNRDGHITEDDMNWSERNPWVQQSYMVGRLFRKIDPNGDGKLSREEWMAFFDKASNGKNEMTSEELRDAWLGGMLPEATWRRTNDRNPAERIVRRRSQVAELRARNSTNPRPTLLRRLRMDGERFSSRMWSRSKPVVLVFGNFTCGPFRSMYPGVEDIYRRFKDDAVFLGVYVREAHPTDGWKMDSNAKVGVAVAQPKTYEERIAVAQQCRS